MANIFQRLNDTFSGSSANPTAMQYTKTIHKYAGLGPNDVIFSTNNKEEYQQKLLQLKQQRLLAKQWKRAQYETQNSALSNQTEVQMMYREADMMDLFPEIGAALDIYMEESTYVKPNGMMINVTSKSERIKSILEDLIYNRLSSNITFPMVTRSTVKYGNTFMLLNITDDNGIIGWKQLPVYEMQRFENGMDNPYSSGFNNTTNIDVDKDDSTKFVWVGKNEYIPYRHWQVAHFRLLYDSLYLPYGVSALNKARRHWRMLSMMEDMMLMYRLERSVERRVFKVNVGAIDEDDVPAYMDEIANNFKRTPIVDPMTGQLDLRRNIMPVWKNTPIPLLDGRIITIEQLADEYNNGADNYVYSVQEGTHKIVPGKVVWCGKNYTAKQMIKVTLDDGGYIVLAPEHEFIMRDGSRKRADKVCVGESVMPFYTECDKQSKTRMERYEKTYNPNSGKFEYTHRLIAADTDKPIVEGVSINTVHHMDYNKYNNNPTNLLWCNFHEHKKMHSQVSKNTWSNEEKRSSIISKLSQSRLDYYQNNQFKQETKDKISNTLKNRYNNGELEHCREISSRNIKKYLSTPQCSENVRRNNYLRKSWLAFNDYNHSERHTQHNEIRRQNKISFWQNGDVETAKRNMTICFDDYIWNEIRTAVVNGIIYNRVTMLEYINTYLIEHLLEINTNKRLHKLNRISREVLEARIKEAGFSTITEYISSIKKNHKIVALEIVEGDDVYCMTVEGLNGEDDRHNFAVCGIDSKLGKSGCFVSNCQMDDFFIPVRDPGEPNPIETLSAGQNMTAMDDIKFVETKMCTALRVPLPFLNFGETTGDGKNLAMLDVRFTRTINRVQQMMLMELTRICIIHLYLLGFSDDLTNFQLTMNNPSSQAEMMELDNLSKKVEMAKSAVADPGGGLPIMSVTRACKEILGWSEKEISDNLDELRLEKALAAELEQTNAIIKKTGLFNRVDNIYGEPGADYGNNAGGQGQDDMGGGMGGGGGLPPMGMDDGMGADMGDDFGGDMGGDIGGADGDMSMGDAAAAEGADAGGGPEPLQETVINNLFKKAVNEQREMAINRSEFYKQKLMEHRQRSTTVSENVKNNIPLYQKNFLINEELNTMANELHDKVENKIVKLDD